MAEEKQPFILSFAPLLSTMPVNLDKTTSINLAKVCSYQASEIDILDDKGKPTGKTELKPCIYFSETDVLVLTEEQNKAFRYYWNLYTRAAGEILAVLSQMFTPPAAHLPVGDAPTTNQ